MNDNKSTLGWGKIQGDGSEIWDAEPVFKGEKVEFKDWLKLLFYPKKWFLYRYMNKHIKVMLKNQAMAHVAGWQIEPVRILDAGCGTGADVIDFKKMFGRRVEVYGLDVVVMQIDLAKEKLKKNGVHAELVCYDGTFLPFEDNFFDAIYTSDVLGHVKDVPAWLKELSRVTKPGGVLSMFSESKLGRHAYIRKYLMTRGLNIDPHAEFHISLYSKTELQKLISRAGFNIEKMYTAFWASYFVHPDEFYPKLNGTGNHKFFFLQFFNIVLYKIKKKLHPFSTAFCELYGLVEMYAVGKWIESQGYVILAKKK